MSRIKTILIPILSLAVLTVSVMGCNTIKGAGKDIEKTGEKIQDAAD